MNRSARAPHKQHDATGRRIPVRTCVACRSRRPQAELLRIAKTSSGFTPDEDRKLEGRGWYICKDKPECSSIKGLGKFARSEAANLVAQLEQWHKNILKKANPLMR